MPFDKVETQVDFPAQERAILEFWDQIAAFEKLRQKNRGKPRWSFLDGPITANNPMGVHHAWGRTYKDAYQRYFAMTGHELRYQNGFDCQGLWVEVEVERELGLKSKRDIENLVPGDPFKSIDKFVQLCKERVNKFARRQSDQSVRLGYWMDWDRTDEDWAKPPDQRKSYFTMAEENNYTIWAFLKKCHERGLVYRGYDAMPWCARCGVGISQQEMHEGYQLVAHRAVFVAFRITRSAGASRLNENLLVWTTTPWTLTSNVAAAVNPQLKYLKVRLRDQVYYVAKGAWTAQRLEEQFKRKEWVEGVPKLKTLEQIFKEKAGKDGLEILGEISGADMVGWEYAGPFDEIPAQAAPSGYPEEVALAAKQQGWASPRSARDIHRVIPWEAVGETEGTGIVHIAPGCGAEDYELGKEHRLVAVAPLDESGVFREGFGFLAGKSALDQAATDAILDNLKQKGVLLDVERYPHSYPHCWRCKTELLFRLVDEWFINMSWRDEIMDVVRRVTFLPESINGQARELDWLKNMGDWMISKKRFWGLALPIWVCHSCNSFEVMGSREELKEHAVAGWTEFEGHTPHRPWIDLVKVKCSKCNQAISRISDVGNPWLDAGIVPYSTMGYNRDRADWGEWFPADFITESFPGQFRNWFYAILAMSTMMERREPTKVILGHAMVRDEHGEEMHKSKGNAIPFEGAADTGYELKDKTGKAQKYPPMSADLMRWMFSRQNPSANINFGPHVAEEIRSKFVMKLWNTYAFFCNYARLDGFEPANAKPQAAGLQDIDRWILSDLQLLVKSAREAFERYDVMAFCLKAEEFVDDKLSNWYVRRNRRRFWKSEQGADKLAAYQTLYTVLTTLTKLFAPVIPFVTETMWRNLASGGRKPPDYVGSAGGGPGNQGANAPRSPESVHHSDYPQVDEGLIDSPLSQDMEALLRLVSLGSAARNTVKIKVRQPLAELRIQPGSDADRRAVERFADQIAEELNLKKVSLHDAAAGPLLTFEVKPNPKNLGPKFGPRLKLVQTALAALDPAAVAEQVQGGKAIELQLEGGPAIVEPSDVWILPRVPTGFAGLTDRGTQLLLDARITPELAREGMAREVVRHVQQSRKEAALEMADRIVLYLHTEDADLAQAIATHRDYIANETLVAQWSETPLGDGAFRQVKIDGKALTIELQKR